MQTMRLPPTPPEDRVIKNPATPPAAINAFTPDSTPPAMRRRAPRVSHDSQLPCSDYVTKEQDHASLANVMLPTVEPVRVEPEGKTPEVPGAFKDAEWESCIPVHEHNPDTKHFDVNSDLSGDTLPILNPQKTQPATTLTVLNDIPIRQKPRKRVRNAKRQNPRTDMLGPSQVASGDWNDLPPDMTGHDSSLGRERNVPIVDLGRKQELTVEVVILQPKVKHKHALRHVKKRHSLRADSRHSPSVVDGTEHNAKEITSHETKPLAQHMLRHQKSFGPKHESPLLGISTGTVYTSSNDHGNIAPTLRHERRPLSADDQNLKALVLNHQTRASELAFGEEKKKKNQVLMPSDYNHPSNNDHEQHVLRHISPDLRLENEAHTFSSEAASPVPQIAGDANMDNAALAMAAAAAAAAASLSPSIKSHRFANTQTPLSGVSDRTEMELCLAKNVSLFPHSNDSVFLVESNTTQNKKSAALPVPLAPRTFRPLSFSFNEDPESASTSSTESLDRSFSTPEIRINGGNVHTVDSPLTNPRTAPEPPVIKFIPPTPSSELDRQPSRIDPSGRPGVQRSDSLINKARRISGSLITPFFPRSTDLDRHAKENRSPHMASLGNDRLHPMWIPNHMWDDDYSPDSGEDDYDPEDYGPLPPGGDTSEHPSTQRSLFPRQMSVRMPGFRGNGGFLLGNSLGVERHGTNRRAHHIELPKRGGHLHQPSARFTFFRALRDRVKRRRVARDEAAREKRRMQLKDSIGVKIVHQGRL